MFNWFTKIKKVQVSSRDSSYKNISLLVVSIISAVLCITKMVKFYQIWSGSPACCGVKDSIRTSYAFYISLVGIITAIFSGFSILLIIHLKF